MTIFKLIHAYQSNSSYCRILTLICVNSLLTDLEYMEIEH